MMVDVFYEIAYMNESSFLLFYYIYFMLDLEFFMSNYVLVADFLAAANSYRLENQPVFGAACITCIKNKKELKIYTSAIYSR